MGYTSSPIKNDFDEKDIISYIGDFSALFLR